MFPGLIYSLENKFVLQGFSSRAAALAETDEAADSQVLGASKAGQKPHIVFFLVARDAGWQHCWSCAALQRNSRDKWFQDL